MIRSHAIPLALQLANLEARHLHALKLTPDHLYLGLLKLLDLDVERYIQQFPTHEQVATVREIRELAEVFNHALLETTQHRRKLRKRLNSKAPFASPLDQSPSPDASYHAVLSRSENLAGGRLIGLMQATLQASPEAALCQLKDDRGNADELIALINKISTSRDCGEDYKKVVEAVRALHQALATVSSGANLSDCWRKVLSGCHAEIESNCAVSFVGREGIVLKISADCQSSWEDLLGEDLAKSLAEIVIQSKDNNGRVRVPVSEL